MGNEHEGQPADNQNSYFDWFFFNLTNKIFSEMGSVFNIKYLILCGCIVQKSTADAPSSPAPGVESLCWMSSLNGILSLI